MKSKSAFIFAVVLLVIFTGTLVANATLPPLTPPPSGGYDSGSNSILDPGCAPNAVDCFVNLPSSGSVTADNGLTATGSNMRLGGVLVQDTTINQSGFEFSITNNGTTFASGADPLNLLSVFGQAYPGIGMLTDGTATGGLQQWISAIQ